MLGEREHYEQKKEEYDKTLSEKRKEQLQDLNGKGEGRALQELE